MTKHRREHVVYRLLATDGTLLYVGCSRQWPGRLGGHRGKGWWDEIATITVERYDTREAALSAETTAIAAECPRHNITGAASKPPREPVWSTHELVYMRDHGYLGVEAIARHLNRSVLSVKMAAHRYRISLRRSRRGIQMIAGRPPSMSVREYAERGTAADLP